MRFPSNKTLAHIAIYGAMGSISAVMFVRHKLVEDIRKADYFKLAVQELRQHKGAVRLLGEPIKELGFDLAQENNICDGKTAHFEVKIKGSKDRGKMYFWATRSNLEQGWILDRLELEIKSEPDKRFILKKPDNQDNSFSSEESS